MLSMVRTDDVSQAPISWLKASALQNKYCMFLSDDVSQAPMSWSKASAPANM